MSSDLHEPRLVGRQASRCPVEYDLPVVVEHLLDRYEAVAAGLRDAGPVRGAIGAGASAGALAPQPPTWKHRISTMSYLLSNFAYYTLERSLVLKLFSPRHLYRWINILQQKRIEVKQDSAN